MVLFQYYYNIIIIIIIFFYYRKTWLFKFFCFISLIYDSIWYVGEQVRHTFAIMGTTNGLSEHHRNVDALQIEKMNMDELPIVRE